MKFICTLFAIFVTSLAGIAVKAQSYSFLKSTQPYTEISTVASSFLASPKFSDTIPLGFNVTIAGITGNKLYVNLRGTVAASGSLGTSPGFETFSTEHSMGAYTYLVTGTAGNRVLVLQFKKVKFDHDFTTNDSANFQVWIKEADNSIEIHFGTSAVNSPDDSYYYKLGGAAIGTKGFWLKGNPSLPTTDTAMGTRLIGTPANGTVYAFKPATTGITTNATSGNIKLYPVPAKRILYVAGVSYNTGCAIYNTSGCLIQHDIRYCDGIDIQMLPPGQYILRIDADSGFKSISFIKE